MSARKAWHRFEVAFTGPFLTGQPLQVCISDYSQIQKRLGDELGRSSSGWTYEGIEWKELDSYGSGGGYTNVVPLVLVNREGEVLKQRLTELQRARPEAERAWVDQAIDGWQWTLRNVKIEMYDFGVGVVTGTYVVRAPFRLRAEDTLRTAESVARLINPLTGDRSAVATSYDLLTREAAAIFGQAVGRCSDLKAQEPWMSPFLHALSDQGEAPSGSEAGAEWGRLLWLHPVFQLTAGPQSSEERMRRISHPFEATFSKTMPFWHGLFSPGIDSSVFVLHTNTHRDKRVPMKLTQLMWAYYGLFMEMDRGLLGMLDSDEWQRPKPLTELEKDADRIFAVSMRVQEARSRLDSALTDLAGGQLSMWEAIAEVQKFNELVEAVEGKVEALRRIADRRVQEAAASRARRTSNILSALTALTVVTVAVTLLSSFLGNRTDTNGHLGLRAAVVAVAFFLAVAVYREVQRR
jgi:hypothetical protein